MPKKPRSASFLEEGAREGARLVQRGRLRRDALVAEAREGVADLFCSEVSAKSIEGHPVGRGRGCRLPLTPALSPQGGERGSGVACPAQ
jgi:hypothetical protein